MESKKAVKPSLFIVPTPIGNLEDITIRAQKILRDVDIIACEDTRRTGNLLKFYKINPKKLTSYHEHNEKEKSILLLNSMMNDKKSVALVTNAGTPGLSDPGFRIIRAAIENEIEITALPGSTAFLPALIASGLPNRSFIFLGFPPQKKGRKQFIEKLSQQEFTTIVYESPHRITKLLIELGEYCGENRQICIAREISKIYEEYIRGTVAEVKANLSGRSSIKGELVVIIEGRN